MYKTLVIYSYNGEDVEKKNNGNSFENLQFFCNVGVPSEDDNIGYIISIKESDIHKVLQLGFDLYTFAKASPNVHIKILTDKYTSNKQQYLCIFQETIAYFVKYINTCNETLPRFFMFLNSGLVGPFLPSYTHFGWSRIFTSKLNYEIKLVGPVISISTSGIQNRSMLFPFVDVSHGFAIDIEALNIFTSRFQPESSNDMLLSKWIFDEGYTIDCLLPMFSGIDWRDDSQVSHKLSSLLGRAEYSRNQTLLSDKNCISFSDTGKYYDGLSIHPLEIVFYKDQPFSKHHNFVHAYKEWRDRHPQTVFYSSIIKAERVCSDEKGFVRQSLVTGKLLEFILKSTESKDGYIYTKFVPVNLIPQLKSDERLQIVFKDHQQMVHTRSFYYNSLVTLRQFRS